MTILGEPILIPEGTPNPDFWYNDQLVQLFQSAMNLMLTSRDGDIENLDKAGNLAAQWLVFTSNGTADTEDSVTHTLGRVPLGIITAVPDKAAVLYSSGTAWTSTTIYVKTDVATVAWKAILF